MVDPMTEYKDNNVHRENKLDSENSEEYRYSLIGGGIVSWVGVMLVLLRQQLLVGTYFAGVLLMGIGVIIVLGGVHAYQKHGEYIEVLGLMFGGGITLFIGVGLSINLREWWAFLVIGLGLLIVSRGFSARSRR
jgi:hypothetical protein